MRNSLRRFSPPGLAICILLCLAACHSTPKLPPTFSIPNLELNVPRLPGWKRIDIPTLTDPAKGGRLLKIGSNPNIPGAPIIEVLLSPLGVEATQLQQFAKDGLQTFTNLDRNGRIHILATSQDTISVGNLQAIESRLTYTIGTGFTRMEFNQQTIYLVLQGRGVQIQALGRTELFSPMAVDISQILGNISGHSTLLSALSPTDRSLRFALYRVQ